MNQQKRCLFSRVSRKPCIHHPCGIFSWKTRGDVHEIREKNLVQMAKQCLDRLLGVASERLSPTQTEGCSMGYPNIQQVNAKPSSCISILYPMISHVFLYQFTGGRKLPMSSPICSHAVGELPKDYYSSGDFS